MKKKIKLIFEEESGQGMVEYGLIIAVVILAALGGLQALSGSVTGLYEKINSEIPW